MDIQNYYEGLVDEIKDHEYLINYKKKLSKMKKKYKSIYFTFLILLVYFFIEHYQLIRIVDGGMIVAVEFSLVI